MKLNKEWHHANPMPKNATKEQKMEWHAEHSKNCSCRKMPDKIAQALEEKNKAPLLLLPHSGEGQEP